MALVTPTEAIRLTGRSKAAFYKDVKAGRVSKTMKDGKTFYDTSELVRAYGELKNTGLAQPSAKTAREDDERLAAMRQEIELLRALLAEKDSHISSLKDSLRLLEYSKKDESPSVSRETKQETGLSPLGLLRRIFKD